MWLSLIWFMLVLFCTIVNLRIKCVTENQKVSVLFCKNLESSFSTWLKHLTLKFLYVLGWSGTHCTVAHSPHLHYHLCFLLKLHNVFNTFVWCVKKLSINDCKKLPVILVSFCLRWHELSPFFKQDLVFLSTYLMNTETGIVSRAFS